MPEKKRRTAAQVHSYIQERVARESRTLSDHAGRGQTVTAEGAAITGTDLQRAAPKIDLIPDKADRKAVHGMFQAFTKYQVLGMLTHPSGKWMRKYGEIVEQIAAEATEVDQVIAPAGSDGRRFG